VVTLPTEVSQNEDVVQRLFPGHGLRSNDPFSHRSMCPLLMSARITALLSIIGIVL
jgi:hypothetical protein